MEKADMYPHDIDAALALARHHFASGGYSGNEATNPGGIQASNTQSGTVHDYSGGDHGSRVVSQTSPSVAARSVGNSSSASWLPSAAPMTPAQLKGAPLSFTPMSYDIPAQPVNYGSFANDMGTRLGLALEQQYGTPAAPAQTAPAMGPWWAPISNLQSPAYPRNNLWAGTMTPPVQNTFNYLPQGYNYQQARQYASGGYADGGNNSISNALRLIKGQP